MSRNSPADSFDSKRLKQGKGVPPAGPSGSNRPFASASSLGANKETGKKAPRGIIKYAKK
jgi:hypothetical protein